MRIHTKIRIGGVSALVWLVAAGTAGATTHILTFDDVQISGCEEIWNENGLDCHFTNTTSEDLDYPYCVLVDPNLSYEGNIGLYFGPARLVVDMTNIKQVEEIQVDIYETYGPGATRVFLYDTEGGLESYNQSHYQGYDTLFLSPVDASSLDRLVVSAFESAVWEIRFSGDQVTGTKQNVTFGTLKALYR